GGTVAGEKSSSSLRWNGLFRDGMGRRIMPRALSGTFFVRPSEAEYVPLFPGGDPVFFPPGRSQQARQRFLHRFLGKDEGVVVDRHQPPGAGVEEHFPCLLRGAVVALEGIGGG